MAGLSETSPHRRPRQYIGSAKSLARGGDEVNAGSRPAQPGFRSDIEGLRAVAVLAVVLFHAGVPGISGGFIGVDVFFVISGFLITGLLWREVSTNGTIRLRGFYGARARRILPASAAVGVVTLIASALLLPPLQARPALIDGITSALYVGNCWFVLESTDYFSSDAPSPFQHYWSLGVEEQVYFVWPIIIIGTAWLVRRLRRRTSAGASLPKAPYVWLVLAITAASFAASLVATAIWQSAAFFLMPTRAWQLALGGLVALTAGRWRRLPPWAAAVIGCAGLGLILLTCNRLGTEAPYPGTAALFPVLGAALVIGAGCATPALGVGRVLSLAPMRAVGRVSYSWYLWHRPVLLLAAPLLGHSLGLAERLATVVVAGILAVLTLRFIENPLRYAPSIRRSATRSLALGGAVTAVAVCVGVALLVVMPPPIGRGPAAPTLTVTAAPLPAGRDNDLYDVAVRHAFAQVQTAVAASADVKAVPSNLDPPLAGTQGEPAAMFKEGCLVGFLEVRQPECATGDTASPTRMVLVGDSNAAMWSPALQQVATRRHWRLESLDKTGCPLLNVSITNPRVHRRYTECAQWRDQVMSRLRVEQPRLIMLSISRLYGADTGIASYSPAWNESLTGLVAQLRATGAEVLVLGPIPDPHTLVPVCLSAHLDDVAACTPTRSTAVTESGISAEAAATKAGGGKYSDVTGLFCTAERCPPIVGNTLVYLDQIHMTMEYSRLLAPVIGTLADRAMYRG